MPDSTRDELSSRKRSRPLTSWLEACRASRGASPGNDEDRPTIAIFGPRSGDSWAYFDPESFSLRKCQASLLGPVSVEPSETLPRWGTMLNGTLFQRKTWERPTSESGFSSWPTILAGDAKASAKENTASLGREIKRMAWPTATVNDSRNGRNRTSGRSNPNSKHHDGVTLCDAIRMWPTPAKSDTEGSRKLPEGTTSTGLRPDGKKAQVGLPNAVKLWPTARATDGTKGGPNQRGSKGDLTLPSAAIRLWPTATARDHKSGKTSEATRGRNARPLLEVVDNWTTPTADDTSPHKAPWPRPSATTYGSSGNGSGGNTASRARPSLETTARNDGGMLNPSWVCALMGFPIGWTALDGPPLRGSGSTTGSRPESASPTEDDLTS